MVDRGVTIEIILSNPNSGKDENYGYGWEVEQVVAQILQTMKRVYWPPTREAKVARDWSGGICQVGVPPKFSHLFEHDENDPQVQSWRYRRMAVCYFQLPGTRMLELHLSPIYSATCTTTELA